MTLEILIYFKNMRIIAVIFVFLLASKAFAASDSATIKKIEIQNNQRVEASTILSYIHLKEGDRFNQESINMSLKEMYSTELFSSIDVGMSGNTLVVKIQENPIVNKIGYEGNKRVNDETINAAISLKPRSVYTKSKVQADVLVIQDLYRKNGRFAAKVEPKIVTLDQGRVDMVFEIDEGNKASVKKIYFIGNKKFSGKKLREVLNTKESRWYTFYSSSDSYDQDRVSYDKELLRKFYTSKGYADFNVTSVISEITENKEAFILNFSMEEGEKYKFGDIQIDSQLPDIKMDMFAKEIKTVKGEVFNATFVDDTIDKITSHLNDIGFAFVEVTPDYQRDLKNRVMGVTYKIKEGPKVYIGKVNVSGNVRTLDKVVRREVRVAEGDPFNAAKLRRSKQRIDNLGFFDKVDVRTEPGDEPDRADVNIDVAERSTGELNFGVGYSTTEGMLGNVSVRERNLLGTARDVKLSLQKSARGDQIDLGFVEPYFMDKDVSTGANVFNITRDNSDQSSYSSSTQGGSVNATYSLTENLRHTVKYSLSTVDITDIQPNASTFVREQAGTNVTSMVGHSFMYDKRDNKFDPSDGYYASFSQDLAGVGGDSQFLRNEARSGFYKPVVREDVIFNASARGGYISGWGGKNVRINDRFFVGGTNLRGFKDAGIGPRDGIDALGGNVYYTASTGFSFPLGLPDELGFKGETFVDVGSLYDVDANGPTVRDENSLRASAGVGLSWTSPLGPIRIDVANPFLKESYDKTQLVRFDFGTRF